MEIVREPQLPPQHQHLLGSTYETQYLYTGFGRVDTVRKKMIVWTKGPNGMEKMFEMDAPDVLPRSYHAEHVRVTVYSESPRVWKEEHSPFEVYYFRQKAKHD